MAHTGVKPARLRIHSTELATDVLRTIGYAARCACGWEGTIRSHHSYARDDARRHNREQHEAESATGSAEASDLG